MGLFSSTCGWVVVVVLLRSVLGLQCLLVESDLGHIAVLAGQHEFSVLLALFLVALAILTIFLELFDSVTVSKRVECVFAAGGCRGDICNHCCLAIASE